MSFGDSVWKREGIGHDTLSDRLYVSAVTLFTAFGIVLATLIAWFTRGWEPNIWVYLGVGLGVPIVGIFIAMLSGNWLVSLAGYTMIVAGLGAITGPTVALYDTGVVITALMATAGVTVVMSLIGIVYPKSLQGWAPWLFGALMALLFVYLAQGIMTGLGVSGSSGFMTIIQYGAAVLFSLYIVYDWNRAVRLPKTLDNAVDCAVAIFLDIINLFFTMLRIFGGRGSSKN